MTEFRNSRIIMRRKWVCSWFHFWRTNQKSRPKNHRYLDNPASRYTLSSALFFAVVGVVFAMVWKGRSVTEARWFSCFRLAWRGYSSLSRTRKLIITFLCSNIVLMKIIHETLISHLNLMSVLVIIWRVVIYHDCWGKQAKMDWFYIGTNFQCINLNVTTT